MTISQYRAPGGYLDRPHSSSLADVLTVILDKGLVIDAYVRVSLLGIELLTIDLRIVVASVDTYLRFAEATNGLALRDEGERRMPGGIEGRREALEGGREDREDRDREDRNREDREDRDREGPARRRERRDERQDDDERREARRRDSDEPREARRRRPQEAGARRRQE